MLAHFFLLHLVSFVSLCVIIQCTCNSKLFTEKINYLSMTKQFERLKNKLTRLEKIDEKRCAHKRTHINQANAKERNSQTICGLRWWWQYYNYLNVCIRQTFHSLTVVSTPATDNNSTNSKRNGCAASTIWSSIGECVANVLVRSYFMFDSS